MDIRISFNQFFNRIRTVEHQQFTRRNRTIKYEVNRSKDVTQSNELRATFSCILIYLVSRRNSGSTKQFHELQVSIDVTSDGVNRVISFNSRSQSGQQTIIRQCTRCRASVQRRLSQSSSGGVNAITVNHDVSTSLHLRNFEVTSYTSGKRSNYIQSRAAIKLVSIFNTRTMLVERNCLLAVSNFTYRNTSTFTYAESFTSISIIFANDTDEFITLAGTRTS